MAKYCLFSKFHKTLISQCRNPGQLCYLLTYAIGVVLVNINSVKIFRQFGKTFCLSFVQCSYQAWVCLQKYLSRPMTSEVQVMSTSEVDSPLSLILCPTFQNAFKQDRLKGSLNKTLMPHNFLS